MLHIWVLASFEEIYSLKKNSEETPSCLLSATSAPMAVTPLQSCNIFGTGEEKQKKLES